jgi:hypothetical protein
MSAPWRDDVGGKTRLGSGYTCLVAPLARLRALRKGLFEGIIDVALIQASDAGFGIYVHWPFCAAKCPYCDFNSHVRHQPSIKPALRRPSSVN